jgi:hypothetical protein
MPKKITKWELVGGLALAVFMVGFGAFCIYVYLVTF